MVSIQTIHCRLRYISLNVKYYENFINPGYYDAFMEFDFKRRKVNYNKSVGKLNRETYAFADDDITLPDIWGDDLKKSEWTPKILEIKTAIEKLTGKKYNVCLCNYYSTANRTIGWHADREELGDTQSIASISLGAEREFKFRIKGEKEECYSIILGNGSLLIMGKGTQEKYEHCVPKSKVKGGRINLTFRLFHAENYNKKYLIKNIPK